nr:MAG TPA: hypothetical protein [Caudoviricetes sp.]
MRKSKLTSRIFEIRFSLEFKNARQCTKPTSNRR